MSFFFSFLLGLFVSCMLMIFASGVCQLAGVPDTPWVITLVGIGCCAIGVTVGWLIGRTL